MTVLLNSERKILLRKFVECLKALKCTQASNGWTNGQFADLALVIILLGNLLIDRSIAGKFIFCVLIAYISVF